MSNKNVFTERERLDLEPIVIEGIPDEQRAAFWNCCTGIQGYKQNYCDHYY